jgi:hypothetical protein
VPFDERALQPPPPRWVLREAETAYAQLALEPTAALMDVPPQHPMPGSKQARGWFLFAMAAVRCVAAAMRFIQLPNQVPYQFTNLYQPRVGFGRLSDLQAVILEVQQDHHLARTPVLLAAVRHLLLEPTKVAQHLQGRARQIQLVLRARRSLVFICDMLCTQRPRQDARHKSGGLQAGAMGAAAHVLTFLSYSSHLGCFAALFTVTLAVTVP